MKLLILLTILLISLRPAQSEAVSWSLECDIYNANSSSHFACMNDATWTTVSDPMSGVTDFEMTLSNFPPSFAGKARYLLHSRN